jgi:hypothetical protein
MQCWWIFDFETDYKVGTGCKDTLVICNSTFMAFEITLKLYLYGKYSIQSMIFCSLCAFIWFRNIEKMLLQMTSVSLQPVPTYIHFLNA